MDGNCFNNHFFNRKTQMLLCLIQCNPKRFLREKEGNALYYSSKYISCNISEFFSS